MYIYEWNICMYYLFYNVLRVVQYGLSVDSLHYESMQSQCRLTAEWFNAVSV